MPSMMRIPALPRSWLAWALSAIIPGVALNVQSQDSGIADGFTRSPTDAALCKENLNQIFEAIQEYQKRYKRLPDWLSDLHPEFLDNPKTFICPFVQRIGDFQTWRDSIRFEVFWDPKLSTTYGYEFCVKDYPLWAGFSTTAREYKMRQQAVIGDEVPILRCFCHRPYLNLSIGGTFYESGFEWESNFKSRPHYKRLLPLACFDDEAFQPRPGHPSGTIPARDPKVSCNLIDLINHYNVSLETPWEWSNPKGKNLDSVPRGITDLDGTGIEFDIRGLIQLNSRMLYAPYPEQVSNIPVLQRGRRVHLLMGTYFPEQPGTNIARCELQYADAAPWSFPIVYGEDVLEWWYDPMKPSSQNATPAWDGVNEAAKASGHRIRLFRVTREIPRPEMRIHSLSFISEQTKSAPFLVAVTID